MKMLFALVLFVKETNIRDPVYVVIKVKLLMPSLVPPVVQERQVDVLAAV
jgi:hypothetical protein